VSARQRLALQIVGGVAVAMIVAGAFGAIDSRDTARDNASEIRAVKLVVTDIQTDLKAINARPVFDQASYTADRLAQATADEAQNQHTAQLADALARTADALNAMDERQIRFDAKLDTLQDTINGRQP